jgi:hypothetical protein
MECSVDDKTITIVFKDFENGDGAFTWEIAGIKNPSSTRTSSPFTNVKFSDAEAHKISELTVQVTDITNKYPAQI